MPRPTAHDLERGRAPIAPAPVESGNTMLLGVRTPISLFAVCLLLLGGAWFAALGDEGKDKGDSRPKAKVDSDDEPLPKGAIRRLGTTRFLHANDITALAYSPDGTMLVTASSDRIVFVWDAKSGKKISQFVVPGEDRQDLGPRHLQFAPGGKFYAVGTGGGAGLYLVDAASGKPLRHLTTDKEKWNSSPAFSPDGKQLAAASGGTVRTWSVPDGAEAEVLTTKNEMIRTVLYTLDGKKVFTVGDKALQCWELKTGKESVRFDKGEEAIYAAALSADGRLLAVGGEKKVRLYDTTTSKLERELEGHAHPVIGIAFSAKGDLLYSGDNAGSVRTWDLRSYRELQKFVIEYRGIWCYAFSPDRTGVATGSINRDHAPRFWNLKDGSERIEFAGPQNSVSHLAFLSEDKLAIGAYGDGKLTLWDPQTGKQVETIPAPGAGFEVGAIAPKGALVAFDADHPARIELRNCATKKEVQTLNLDPNAFQRFALSPDGTMIATQERGEGVNQHIRIYSVPKGKRIATAESADQSYSDLRFSPDGNTGGG